MGIMPLLRFSTRFSSTSSAMTRFPRSAKQAAVTNPTYPTPTTQICFIFLPLFGFQIISSQPFTNLGYLFHDRHACNKLLPPIELFESLMDYLQKAFHMDWLRYIPVTPCLHGTEPVP